MKTLKKGTDIIRVKEEKVNDYLKHGYSYTSKSEWKEKVRGVKQNEDTSTEEVKPKTKRGKNKSE